MHHAPAQPSVAAPPDPAAAPAAGLPDAAAPARSPIFSLVVPLRDEAPNVAPLVAEIETFCTALGAFECLLVDDGSRDATRRLALEQAEGRPWLRVLAHDRGAGQSAAVHSGVVAARAPVICTLDGDGQNPPADLALVLAPLLDPLAPAGLGLVAGQRVGRRDGLSKRLASLAGNTIRAALLRDGTRDTGCGIKAFRRDAFLALPYFNHMHRFLPALFARDGWQVRHVDVGHRARTAGRSKYSNLSRALAGAYDLVGVSWLILRRKRAQGRELTERGAPRAP